MKDIPFKRFLKLCKNERFLYPNIFSCGMIIQRYAKIGERGQIAIPKDIREKEGIMPKQIVRIMSINGEISIKLLRKEKRPENKILEILERIKLTDKDWREIKKDREER